MIENASTSHYQFQAHMSALHAAYHSAWCYSCSTLYATYWHVPKRINISATLHMTKWNMSYSHFSELGVFVGLEFIHLGFNSARFLDSLAASLLGISNSLLQINQLLLDDLYSLLKLHVHSWVIDAAKKGIPSRLPVHVCFAQYVSPIMKAGVFEDQVAAL